LIGAILIWHNFLMMSYLSVKWAGDFIEKCCSWLHGPDAHEIEVNTPERGHVLVCLPQFYEHLRMIV
jgi:hypothetical protein